MGVIALIVSVVIDTVWPLRGRAQERAFDPDARSSTLDDAADPLADTLADPFAEPLADTPFDSASAGPAGSSAPRLQHPLERYALALIDGMASDTGGGPSPMPDSTQRQLSAPGWLVVVGVPVLVVACAQWFLGAIAGLLVFMLHVAVLYLTVAPGAVYRQFSALQLLIGAGEHGSARIVLARWIRLGGGWRPGPDAAVAAAGGAAPHHVAGYAAAHAILSAYREVFAPLFWYAILPGATGPILYLFASFAACHSYPFAHTALYWLDWIPLRLASLGFALVGRFEDTVFALRAVIAIRPATDTAGDPCLHQRLVLLPAAAGAMGLRLKDAGVDAQLRKHLPDFDPPGADQEMSSLQPVAGLLVRSSIVWLGAYLLARMLF